MVEVLEAQRFVRDLFSAMGVPANAADEMADVLIAADYMGQRSMGIYRLPVIVEDLLKLKIDPRMQPKVVNEREAMAFVDGYNSPGPVVANFCMDLAMQKARNGAIGFVAVRRSNCIGMASWYTCQALAQRMIGLCMTNGQPLLVPSGGVEPLLGSNCLACSAGTTQEQFVVDIGMSAYSIERLEQEHREGRLWKLPRQLALDSCGKPTCSAAEALHAQRMRPFAPEHKGFGLAAMVDILCGVMTGARYASQVQRRGLFEKGSEIADLGQIFIAIDPMHFCASFEERLADFHQQLRDILPNDVNEPALIPGDKEHQHMEMVDHQGGIILSPHTISVLKEMGERFSLAPLLVKYGDEGFSTNET
ncbi:hypothetical protein KR222_005891, partial [Zaprionus bogoriensis]